MMKRLKDLFFTFANVTTYVVAGTAIYISIFQHDADLGADILLQILFVSFTTSLGIFLYPQREVCKKEIILRIFIHYIYVNVIVLWCGLWFGWYDINSMAMIMGMLATIAIVFGSVSFVCWKKAEKESLLINERLKEYQGEKDDN